MTYPKGKSGKLPLLPKNVLHNAASGSGFNSIPEKFVPVVREHGLLAYGVRPKAGPLQDRPAHACDWTQDPAADQYVCPHGTTVAGHAWTRWVKYLGNPARWPQPDLFSEDRYSNRHVGATQVQPLWHGGPVPSSPFPSGSGGPSKPAWAKAAHFASIYGAGELGGPQDSDGSKGYVKHPVHGVFGVHQQPGATWWITSNGAPIGIAGIPVFACSDGAADWDGEPIDFDPDVHEGHFGSVIPGHPWNEWVPAEATLPYFDPYGPTPEAQQTPAGIDVCPLAHPAGLTPQAKPAKGFFVHPVTGKVQGTTLKPYNMWSNAKGQAAVVLPSVVDAIAQAVKLKNKGAGPFAAALAAEVEKVKAAIEEDVKVQLYGKPGHGKVKPMTGLATVILHPDGSTSEVPQEVHYCQWTQAPIHWGKSPAEEWACPHGTNASTEDLWQWKKAHDGAAVIAPFDAPIPVLPPLPLWQQVAPSEPIEDLKAVLLKYQALDPSILKGQAAKLLVLDDPTPQATKQWWCVDCGHMQFDPAEWTLYTCNNCFGHDCMDEDPFYHDHEEA